MGKGGSFEEDAFGPDLRSTRRVCVTNTSPETVDDVEIYLEEFTPQGAAADCWKSQARATRLEQQRVSAGIVTTDQSQCALLWKGAGLEHFGSSVAVSEGPSPAFGQDRSQIHGFLALPAQEYLSQSLRRK